MNKIHLQLAISKNANNSYDYQYYSVFDNGVVVKVEGFVVEQATKFKIELTSRARLNYSIKECLIPGHQNVVTVEKISDKKVTVIDLDNEPKPEDYNFIIIATDDHTGEQIVCDPQIRNKRTE